MYKRIKDLRENNNLTQRELAQRLCVSPSCYSKYEKGDHVPTWFFVRLAEYYGISIDYIVGRSDIKEIR